ncbi:MAG: Hsp70 family protein [Candidatus Methanomethylophilaceae archaeon]|nr:Hsp70 family protein [Candidatus Methanomethylophilaceae archaeon]
MVRVGIDLGTTYSAVGVCKDGKPVIIKNSYGKELTPSNICFYEDDVLVGDEAYDMMASGAGDGVTAFKRRMGIPGAVVTHDGKEYTAEDLSAILLRHLIKDASDALGERITDAVITVPQYFDETKRQSTIKAGEACGINIIQIINEPTSAALYYGYNYSKQKTLMVYDLGGGTFDVNVISFDNGKTDVLASKGDHYLGGKNWDEALMNLACDEFEDEYGVDPRKDLVCKNMMMVTAEKVKRQLSVSTSAPFVIEYQGWTGKYAMTRDAFERASEHLLITTKKLCDDVLEDCGMKWSEIDEILLIGGSSRMPMVQSFLKTETGRPVVHHPDMELAVAKGAAIAAMPSLRRKGDGMISETILTDVTAHSLGAIAVEEGQDRYINEIMIPRNSRIPCRFTKKFLIKERSWTSMIEVFATQGESADPNDCVIISRSEISGFRNDGKGLTIDITYTYDKNGVVAITAEHDGSPLSVKTTPLPEDITWVTGKPSERKDAREAIRKSIAICLDVSRSMKSDKSSSVVPLEEAKKSIKSFVDGFDESEGNLFSLIVYSEKEDVACEPTSDRKMFKDAVDRVKLKSTGRGTEAVPINLARSVAEKAGYLCVIVILTDGRWEKNMDKAITQSRECRDEGIPIFALGFGDADRGFLKQIATVDNGGMYTQIENLGSTFDTIATAIKTENMGIRTKE